jgi:flagellar biosynthesis GTPase FlhF
MVSTSHPNASDLFARDLGGLVKFFAMKMRYVPPNEDLCRLEDIIVPTANIRIDEEVRASGFSKDDDDILLRFIHDTKKDVSNDNQDDDDDDDDDEEEEGEEEEEEETYSRKKKPSKKSVSRVTDFLNSSNRTVENKEEEGEGENKEKTLNEFSELKIGENNENGENEENGVSDISCIPKQLHRNENSNGWIPEPKDLLDLEEVLDGFSSDEEGAGGGKGSVAVMTEDMLQKVKDKTRRYDYHDALFLQKSNLTRYTIIKTFDIIVSSLSICQCTFVIHQS